MKRTLEEVTWRQVKKDVKKINLQLFSAIEKLKSADDLVLLRAKYTFGDLMLDQGVLNVPVDGSLYPVSSAKCPDHLKKKLTYSKIPLFLVMSKRPEVFVKTQARTIPLNLFKPGDLLGLFETLDSRFNIFSDPKWSVSAGARSLFMLPRVADSANLRKLKLVCNLPNDIDLTRLEDHWRCFTGIVNSDAMKVDWQSEILIFTTDWFQQGEKQKWTEFHEEICNQAWHQAQFAISKIGNILNWEYFVDAISHRRLKPPPYLSDQVKHLLSIASGRLPGFKVAIEEDVAPIQLIQDIFIEIYQLKKYIPNLMRIALPTVGKREPVYYSLSHPTLMEGSPLKKIASTIMLDLRDIKVLMETIMKEVKKNNCFDSYGIQCADFDYFHVEKDIFGDIKPSILIAQEDPSFYQNKYSSSDRDFCATSQFWRGCIKVTT